MAKVSQENKKKNAFGKTAEFELQKSQNILLLLFRQKHTGGFKFTQSSEGWAAL